jgi:hypothetical protein
LPSQISYSTYTSEPSKPAAFTICP